MAAHRIVGKHLNQCIRPQYLDLETLPPASGCKLFPQFSGYQYSYLQLMRVANGQLGQSPLFGDHFRVAQ